MPRPLRPHHPGAVFHLNAVRAPLVDDPAHYRWTSHLAYAGVKNEHEPMARLDALVDVRTGLQLFEPEGTAASRRTAYLRCLEWRLERDAWLLADDLNGDAGPAPPDPPDPNAQPDWAACYPPLFSDGAIPNEPDGCGPSGQCDDLARDDSARDDLAEITLEVLARFIRDGTPLNLDDVRGRSRKPAVVAARGEIAWRAVRAGHTRKEVAAYLDVTEQCIGYILARRRNASDDEPSPPM